ncbi:flagellin N-terminal helical domain-containing protein [Pontibacillus marinus]|uniref:Flagellin n=1 Tax=Pontibacillus marinus BH030004 = DSM 16465 TaxID=1385511 RepID=A0A0A5G420_9BACI|nr:flagellin [Pontibacillus marinus]KGX86799.1 hypothetical protein N783_11555 [Pontibacillus marinus BH030004 = DSM 16465]
MRINHNIAALNTHRQLSQANNANQQSMEKLSSGLRINRAGDDAAGLAISEKMRGQIRGLEQAERNAQDGISMIQTAEGALNETHSILQRMRELSVQGANDTATDADRAELQKEVSQLKEEIDRISNTTEFNTKKLLNGDLQSVQKAQGDVLESANVDFKNSLSGDPGENAINIQSGSNDTLTIEYGGSGSTEDITLTAGTYTQSELVSEINTQLTGSANLGDLSVSDTSGSLEFTDGDGSGDATGFTIKTSGNAASDLGISSDLVVADAGSATAASTVSHDSYSIAAGSNDQFNVSLNGNSATTVTLTAGDYTSIDALNTEVNNALDAAGVGITAAVSEDGESLEFNADTKGDTFEMTEGNAGLGQLGVTDGAQTGTLTSLGNEDGDSLGVKDGDTVRINGQINGKAISEATLSVTANTSLNDLTSSIETAFGLDTDSVSITSEGELQVNGKDGESNDLQNLSLSIDGNESFNNHFSNFSEVQDAQDESTNHSAVFQIGANQGQTMKVDINEMSVGSLSLSSVDISSQQGAENSVTVINDAIEQVSAERSKLGAFQNRMEHSINNLGTSSENLTAAESRIRDVDMAKEMMNQTKQNILAQASQSMLAKANQQPQGVLQLLR